MSTLGSLAALLVQMAISRSREYLADSTGAAISGKYAGKPGSEPYVYCKSIIRSAINKPFQ